MVVLPVSLGDGICDLERALFYVCSKTVRGHARSSNKVAGNGGGGVWLRTFATPPNARHTYATKLKQGSEKEGYYIHVLRSGCTR